jgi:heptosyltransferase-2
MIRSMVVRAPNWLGDTVMALPALQALRRADPGTRIVVVGTWAPLLAGQGVADVLLPYNTGTDRRRLIDRRLGADPADVTVLLANSLGAALSARRWRSRRRIGFATDLRALLLTDPISLPAPRRHQVDEYLLLAEAAGGRVERVVPRWRRCADARIDQAVSAVLDASGVPLAAAADGAASSRRPLVGLHLGAAAGAAKRWIPERFGELAADLTASGMIPLLLGASGDLGAAERAIVAAGGRLCSAAGRDRLDVLPHLLGRLDCLVSGDTGVAHLAAAMNVPTVTLFGPTDRRLTAPRGALARIVDSHAPCAPCFLTECPIDHVCMRGISACTVAEQVRAAVEASPRTARADASRSG